MNRFVQIIASFFYIGYLPWAPGTVASFAALFLAWIFNPALPALFFIFCFLGFLVSRPAVQVFADRDPARFVMDEVCGMMLSVLWLPRILWVWAAALVLFRFLDIEKPLLIGRLQKRGRPLDIMWDDLAAGFAVNVLLQVLVFITGIT
jgi:phosphatidylglycerophosphatase A